jgi:hypothetical protein
MKTSKLKTSRLLLLLVLLGNLFSVCAYSAEEPSADVTREDIQIEKVWQEGTVQFTETEAIAESGTRYKISPLPTDPELLAEFNTLSRAEMEQFYKRRNSILASIIEKMDKEGQSKFLGRYAVVKGRVIKFFKRDKTQGPSLKDTEQLVEIGKEELQELVRKVEAELWRSCKLISDVNVKGRSLALNGAVGLGVKKTGMILNWAFGIGYFKNEQTGDSYLEFFAIQERFHKAFTYALPSYAGVKVSWLNWRNEKDIERFGTARGTGINMPTALPYIFRSPNEFSLATGMGIDAVDLIVPMQSFAQTYMTKWKRSHFRINFKSKDPVRMCRRFYAPSSSSY